MYFGLRVVQHNLLGFVGDCSGCVFCLFGLLIDFDCGGLVCYYAFCLVVRQIVWCDWLLLLLIVWFRSCCGVVVYVSVHGCGCCFGLRRGSFGLADCWLGLVVRLCLPWCFAFVSLVVCLYCC